MKVGELKDRLSNYDQNLDIKIMVPGLTENQDILKFLVGVNKKDNADVLIFQVGVIPAPTPDYPKDCPKYPGLVSYNYTFNPTLPHEVGSNKTWWAVANKDTGVVEKGRRYTICFALSNYYCIIADNGMQAYELKNAFSHVISET